MAKSEQQGKEDETQEGQEPRIQALLCGLGRLGASFRDGDTVVFGPRIPRKVHEVTKEEDSE